MDKLAMFKIVLNRISSIQKMGNSKNMKEIPITVGELVTLYHTDKHETKAALNELVKMGMLWKVIVERKTAPLTAWDAKKGFKSREYKEAEYRLTEKAETYINSLRNN